jgi:hypothetical protein
MYNYKSKGEGCGDRMSPPHKFDRGEGYGMKCPHNV